MQLSNTKTEVDNLKILTVTTMPLRQSRRPATCELVFLLHGRERAVNTRDKEGLMLGVS